MKMMCDFRDDRDSFPYFFVTVLIDILALSSNQEHGGVMPACWLPDAGQMVACAKMSDKHHRRIILPPAITDQAVRAVRPKGRPPG